MNNHYLFNKLLLFIIFIFLSDSIFTQVKDINDTIFIDGPYENRQVFIRNTNGSIFQITQFDTFEIIEELYISPNNDKLIIYHRNNNENAYKITLYDLINNTIISEKYPGWRCDNIIWTNEYIIYKWGTSGGGTRFDYYDFRLNLVNEICSYYFFIDEESNIIISLPIYFAELGEINIFRFSDGFKLNTINYSNELNENYIVDKCTKLKNKKYQLDLRLSLSNTIVKIILVID